MPKAKVKSSAKVRSKAPVRTRPAGKPKATSRGKGGKRPVEPSRIEVVGKRRLLDDFFKIDEQIIRHERFDGTMSPERRTLVFERGDAAAALLYDPKKQCVIVTRQLRLPTLGKNGSTGWLTEAAAGMIPAGETAAQCIAREIKEETGYDVAKLVPVARFFSSPGGSSELIHLFCAEVKVSDRTSQGGGVVAEGENIRIDEIAVVRFFRMLDRLEIADPKLIVAGQWLRRRLKS